MRERFIQYLIALTQLGLLDWIDIWSTSVDPTGEPWKECWYSQIDDFYKIYLKWGSNDSEKFLNFIVFAPGINAEWKDPKYAQLFEYLLQTIQDSQKDVKNKYLGKVIQALQARTGIKF